MKKGIYSKTPWPCACLWRCNTNWTHPCGDCERPPPLLREPDGYVLNWTPDGGFPEDVIEAAGLGAPAPTAPKDMVENPGHYTHGAIEVWDAIIAWGLDFPCGNVIKYVARHEHKGAPLEDLRKARQYLNRKIEELEKDQSHEQ